MLYIPSYVPIYVLLAGVLISFLVGANYGYWDSARESKKRVK